MVPKTRAKFTCQSITKMKLWNGELGYMARLIPVVGGSPENDSFYKATPGGSIELQTVREDHFQVGQDYFVDFTAAIAQ